MTPDEIPGIPFLARVWVDSAAMGCGWKGLLVYAKEGNRIRVLDTSTLDHAQIILSETKMFNVTDSPVYLRVCRRRLHDRVKDFERMGPVYQGRARSRSVTKALRVLDAELTDPD